MLFVVTFFSTVSVVSGAYVLLAIMRPEVLAVRIGSLGPRAAAAFVALDIGVTSLVVAGLGYLIRPYLAI